MSKHETEAYKLETTRNGLFAVLTRKVDGADVHFQGDDASLILDEVAELEESWRGKPARFKEFFNWLASQYDDVMRRRIYN